MPKPSDRHSTRRRWSEAEARDALDALARSGLSLRAFALREGLKHERLFRWRRRFQRTTNGRSPKKPVAFVEVRHGHPERIEVVLRSGRVLRCAEEIAVGTLRRLVDVLEQDPAC